MAELTKLESKLAEVLGLAMAAQGATDKVRGMLEDDESEHAQTLDRMKKEAEETEERCVSLADGLDGKKTAILESARETRGEATEMMETYLEGEDEALDGFEFLTMAEAGEVGHWSIVQTMSEKAGDDRFRELAEWAVPIQRRHFDEALQASLAIAREEDPNEVDD